MKNQQAKKRVMRLEGILFSYPQEVLGKTISGTQVILGYLLVLPCLNLIVNE